MNFLAGDLGGSKTILAILDDNHKLEVLYKKYYASRQWPSFNNIVEDFIENIPNNVEAPKFGCIGVAGIVSKGSSEITNLRWKINQKDICNSFGLIQLELINDFSVLVYGLPFLSKSQVIPIQNQSTLNNNNPSNGIIAILGAGTGLGITRGIKTNSGIQAFPSEGGHREFAPRNQTEWDLANWLKTDLGLKRLSIERVVSGTGLGHIARWLLIKSEASNHLLYKIAKTSEDKAYSQSNLPELVSNAARQGDSLMSEVLKIWLSAYGSAAGDLALQELCSSGLWIAGGTASKHIQGFRSKTFIDAFRNKGRFRPYLEQLSIMALIDPEATIFSAGCRAKMLVN